MLILILLNNLFYLINYIGFAVNLILVL